MNPFNIFPAPDTIYFAFFRVIYEISNGDLDGQGGG
jgi:hypothetical protein